MKIKATALALAATMVTAWSVAADAAYQVPQTPAAGSGSTLLFSAWFTNADGSGDSYTRDVGQTFSSFTTASAPSIQIDLAADTNYNTFASAATAAGASIIWNVVSAIIPTPATPGILARLDTTSSQDLTAGDVSNASTVAAALNLGKFMSLLNANCSFSATGSCLSTNAANTWNINNPSSNWDALLGGVMGFDSTASPGGTLKFYNFAASNQSSGTSSVITLVGTGVNPQVFGLSSSGELTWNVGAVPEPSSWLLLAAGLAMVGVIARRRVGQQ